MLLFSYIVPQYNIHILCVILFSFVFLFSFFTHILQFTPLLFMFIIPLPHTAIFYISEWCDKATCHNEVQLTPSVFSLNQ